MASTPDIPAPPDPNKAAIAGSLEDMKNFPYRYIIDAVAKLGGKWTDPSTGQTYNFTHLGDVDQAKTMSNKMARALLDIQKNYGADFIKQRMADLERSDPTGFAARKQLFQKIMEDSQKQPNRPLAQDTQDQIMQMLQENGKLTGGPGGELEQVEQGVRGGQIARGIDLGNAPAQQEAAAVEHASEAKQTTSQQQALAYQQLGISPEDVQYRRIQQSLSNLGAFVNGQTPTSQFKALSTVSNAAAPFTTTGLPNATTDPNAALNGINFANKIYEGQTNWNNNQVNPWLSGLNMVTNTLGIARNLGWNPFGTTTPNTVNPATIPTAANNWT